MGIALALQEKIHDYSMALSSNWATKQSAATSVHSTNMRAAAADLKEDGTGTACSHHEEIRQITERIQKSVEVLYKEPAQSEKPQKPQGKPAAKPKEQHAERKPMKHSSGKKKIQVDQAEESDEDGVGHEDMGVKEGSDRSGSDSEDSDPTQFDAVADAADIEEDWDAEVSKQHVRTLLESLKTEKRTDVMNKLHGWFAEKSKKVNTEIEVLSSLEEERAAKEADLTAAHATVHKGIEDREMRSFVTLNNFHRKLKAHTGNARLKTRTKLSKGKGLNRRQLDDDSDDESQLDVSELRAQLLDRDSPLRKCLLQATSDGPGTVKASDLLEVIAMQQEEIEALNGRVDQNDKKVEVLKAALDHCSSQGNPTDGEAKGAAAPGGDDKAFSELDPAVQEVITTIKEEVEQQKISEIMAKKDSQDEGADKPPDEAEIQALEKECSELRLQLKELDIELKMMKSPEERERELALKLEKIQNGELDDVDGLPGSDTPAGKAMAEGAGMKDKLQAELEKIQVENDALQEQLKKYEDLMQTAEKTLKMMEEQKNIFLQSVEQAKHNLVIEKLPTEAEDPVKSAFALDDAEEDALDEEENRKQQEAFDKLHEEESRLQKEVEELEDELEAARNRVTSEKDKQNDLKQQIERQKKRLY